MRLGGGDGAVSLREIEGGITAPQGFLAASLFCGIKGGTGQPDTILIDAGGPAAAAGTFTTNRVKAAPATG